MTVQTVLFMSTCASYQIAVCFLCTWYCLATMLALKLNKVIMQTLKRRGLIDSLLQSYATIIPQKVSKNFCFIHTSNTYSVGYIYMCVCMFFQIDLKGLSTVSNCNLQQMVLKSEIFFFTLHFWIYPNNLAREIESEE